MQQVPRRVEEIVLGKSASVCAQQNSGREEEHSTHRGEGEGRPVSQALFQEVSSCDENPVCDDVSSECCVHDHDVVQMLVGQACVASRCVDQDDADDTDQLEI